MHRRFAATLSAILGKPQVTADDLIRKDRRRSKADAGESSSFHGELHNDALDLQTIATNDLKVETVTRVTRATDVDSRGSNLLYIFTYSHIYFVVLIYYYYCKRRLFGFS
jgi:hypothetical protein